MAKTIETSINQSEGTLTVRVLGVGEIVFNMDAVSVRIVLAVSGVGLAGVGVITAGIRRRRTA